MVFELEFGVANLTVHPRPRRRLRGLHTHARLVVRPLRGGERWREQREQGE